MITTEFTALALALVVLAAVLHIVRARGRFPRDSGLTSASGITWIVTAFVIVGAMIDQATQHPDSMDPVALLCGSVSAAMALLYGLDAVVPTMIAAARRADTGTAPVDRETDSGHAAGPRR